MRARHYAAAPPVVVERMRAEARLLPSARDLFPQLRERVLASRPVLGWDVNGKRQARAPRPGVKATPIYGAPTFRNRIDSKGEHI